MEKLSNLGHTKILSTQHDVVLFYLNAPKYLDKYNYRKEAIAEIYENYFNTKLVHASLHFKPEDGKEAFKKLVNKKFVHYVLYYSSKHKLIHKLLWVLRRLPI